MSSSIFVCHHAVWHTVTQDGGKIMISKPRSWMKEATMIACAKPGRIYPLKKAVCLSSLFLPYKSCQKELNCLEDWWIGKLEKRCSSYLFGERLPYLQEACLKGQLLSLCLSVSLTNTSGVELS